jgi:hypothetical protein
MEKYNFDVKVTKAIDDMQQEVNFSQYINCKSWIASYKNGRFLPAV